MIINKIAMEIENWINHVVGEMEMEGKVRKRQISAEMKIILLLFIDQMEVERRKRYSWSSLNKSEMGEIHEVLPV